MADARFQSPEEFRTVIDRLLTMLGTHDEAGPKLKEADAPQRLEFTDLQLVVNVRSAREGEEGHLSWTWSDEIDWAPRVKLAMSSEVANAYFQGRENLALALARRRIQASGEVRSTLALLPLAAPVFERYRELLEAEYPHLVV